MQITKVLAGVMLCTSPIIFAEPQDLTVADYQRAEQLLPQFTNDLVTGTVDYPQWLDKNTLVYRSQTAQGYQFVQVSALDGAKKPAFDHQKLADAINLITKSTITASNLPFRVMQFNDDKTTITFSVKGVALACDLSQHSCVKAAEKHKHESVAPNGKMAVFIRDNNLWLRDIASNKIQQLTNDGSEDFGWATNNAGWVKTDDPVLLWSPDSKYIKTFKHDGRDVGNMYLVSTNVGHPTLSAWKYPLPGDKKIFEIHRAIIDVEQKSVMPLAMDADPHRSSITDHIAGRPTEFGTLLDAQWSDDGKSIAFLSNSRDHKTATLRVANVGSNKVKTILQEKTDTYFESGYNKINWHYLPESNEVIWFSERSNWGHLYLYDLTTGKIKNQITQGEWAVLQVLNIDKSDRTIYFTAGGKETGDPYYQYLYRVNFDGSGLTLLTPETAHHKITFGPDGAYFLDEYSTPSAPGKSLIRSTKGEHSVVIETTNISQLLTTHWQPPMEFSVKARDGKTDLYGLLYKPSNFDKNQKYPVINYLYPGPQSGSVGSRAFSASRRDKQAIAELGFILIELDALGTPGRSKSFHDFYYGNMGDNGIADQIAGIKELAGKYSWIDIDRVGIWGHSGGGYASTRAMFDYPDFYKVAVSGAGNHDNRNYEDDWGEKWQGLLVKEGDGDNYDNQANQLKVDGLKGKLLLAHGTADSNVPPYNTLLVVDALIAANKDFDLLMLPNRGHGFAYEPYMMRRRWDYFVEHLKQVNYPKQFTFTDVKNK